MGTEDRDHVFHTRTAMSPHLPGMHSSWTSGSWERWECYSETARWMFFVEHRARCSPMASHDSAITHTSLPTVEPIQAWWHSAHWHAASFPRCSHSLKDVLKWPWRKGNIQHSCSARFCTDQYLLSSGLWLNPVSPAQTVCLKSVSTLDKDN